ncbi:MAG: hypothetical protein A3J73_04780 [Planctomycetes bacterium RIFCSPHIGHO2_02_FULL_38_41]|nr:MAG: hypothetical protein A3J73_04780 [Planctomycetes bacterium RIFCSPHIGHO2_02_FULL_38_41]
MTSILKYFLLIFRFGFGKKQIEKILTEIKDEMNRRLKNIKSLIKVRLLCPSVQTVYYFVSLSFYYFAFVMIKKGS